MENKSNKVLSFILSMIVPRKMVERLKMPFWVAVIMLIASCLLNVATPNIHASKDSEEMLKCPDSIYNMPDDLQLLNKSGEAIEGFGVTSYSSQTLSFLVNGEVQEKTVSGYGLGNVNPDNYYGSYFDEKTGRYVDVTLVVDPTVYSGLGKIDSPVVLSNFDLEGYFNQTPKDNTDYVLYVASFDYFYVSYNFGKNNSTTLKSYNYEVEDSQFVYYLPASEEELVLNEYGNFDTTKWTKKVSENEVIDFSTTIEGADKIVPVMRHNKNLMHSLYSYYYNYSDINSMTEDGISSLTSLISNSFGKFAKGVFDAMVLVDASLIKSSAIMISFLVNVLFVLIISAVTWLISRRMNMTKFKNYFTICTICFFDVSIVSLVVGIFFMYSEISFFLLVAAAIYYIVSTLLINTMKPKEEDNNTFDNNNHEPIEKKPVQYRDLNDGIDHIG